MWGIVRSCLGYFNPMLEVRMGYSWGIRGVFMGYTYVSGMCRVCIGYVSGKCRNKRDAARVLIHISCGKSVNVRE